MTSKQQVFDQVGGSLYGKQDFVKSPPWTVDALVASKHPPPRGRILDPFAGDGAILRRLIDHGWDPAELHACELREEEHAGLGQIGLGSVTIGDWFDSRELMGYGYPSCPTCAGKGNNHRSDGCPNHGGCGPWIGWPATAIVTNVPWSILERAVVSCLDTDGRGHLDYVASLQPLEELGGVDRCTWLSAYPPTALVSLRRRPFPKAARGCGWFVWERGAPPMEFEIR